MPPTYTTSWTAAINSAFINRYNPAIPAKANINPTAARTIFRASATLKAAAAVTAANRKNSTAGNGPAEGTMAARVRSKLLARMEIGKLT